MNPLRTRRVQSFLIVSVFTATSVVAATDQPMRSAPTEMTSGSIDVGRQEGRAWTDFNKDGRADYCRVVGNNGAGGYLRCTLSAKTEFGTEVSSFQLDAGFHEGRTWADFDGDGRSDYFRIVEANGNHGRIKVTLSEGARFGNEITSPELDLQYWEGRAAADFNGDGYDDYCWVHTANGREGQVSCILSDKGEDFGTVIDSLKIDVGFYEGRVWADFNGDGKADYCRVVDSNSGQGKVQCSLSLGDRFGNEITTNNTIAVGNYEGRAWPHFFGTKRTDYCRADNDRLRCTKATEKGFGGEVVSGVLDAGFHEGRAWPDYNGDGKADYCRVITKNGNDGTLACTPSTGTTGSGFGDTVTWGTLDAGRWEGRSWTDFDGDGTANEYCRVVGNNHGQSNVRCTLLR